MNFDPNELGRLLLAVSAQRAEREVAMVRAVSMVVLRIAAVRLSMGARQ